MKRLKKSWLTLQRGVFKNYLYTVRGFEPTQVQQYLNKYDNVITINNIIDWMNVPTAAIFIKVKNS